MYADPQIQTDLLSTNLRVLGNITASDYNIDLAYGLIPNKGGNPIYLDETYYTIDVVSQTQTIKDGFYDYSDTDMSSAVQPCNSTKNDLQPFPFVT